MVLKQRLNSFWFCSIQVWILLLKYAVVYEFKLNIQLYIFSCIYNISVNILVLCVHSMN